MAINGNKLAKDVSIKEGKKRPRGINLPIAQISEVQKETKTALRQYSDKEIIAWVRD